MSSGITRVGLITATSLVIANMVGTGVFTSLGFQVSEIPSVFPLIGLWVVGGVIALCGALSYGELGAALPRSGGEYHLLSIIYHPAVGFVSGWVSATLGFGAPTALAAIALGKYTSAVFPVINETHLAGGVVVLITAIHSYSVKAGSLFQVTSTSLKVLLILVFVIAAFFIPQPQSISIIPSWDEVKLMVSPSFAVALIYVSYAYTGWNAAVYIAGEIREPARNLPKALFVGTLVVLLLYVALNYVFLYSVPMGELADVVEVGFLSASRIFGSAGGEIMSMLISLLLVSTISAMVFVGPRISMTIGEDMPLFALLGKKSVNGIPVNALIFQMVVTLLFIYTSSFEQVLIYASFMLTLFTCMTVLGVLVLRWRRPGLPRPYKTWGYPITPLIHVLLSLWIMAYVFRDKTTESLIGLGIGATGLVFYFINAIWFANPADGAGKTIKEKKNDH